MHLIQSLKNEFCFDLPIFSKYPATSINSYFYKMTLDRLLIGLTAQQKGTTAQWYTNKTSLFKTKSNNIRFVFSLKIYFPNGILER